MLRRTLLSLFPGSALAAQISAAHQHAQRAAVTGAALEYFDAATAAEVEAMAARIIPSEPGSPGAREAGVLYFIDRSLNTWDRDQQDMYRKGLADIDARRRATFPNAPNFAALPAESQDALLKAIETTPFFKQLRGHTMLGFFGDPSQGGNRGQVGWKLIGFEGEFSHQPPFGFYDREGH